ncbi:MAG: glycine--tRNA ligase subunit beta [Candidatus Aquicultor sp.]|nr:glycine--tRNA ligase subunit beta [Candidatus Aquicultor sp.]
MSKHDLLLEIGTEEIPAAAVVIGKDQLKEKAEALLKRHRLNFDIMNAFGSPRRLAIMAVGLDEKQETVTIEAKGPAKKAAFTDDGQPTKAAIGFAKSQGVDVESLTVKSVEGGEYVFAVKEEEGRNAVEIFREILPELIKSLSFPKAMRWGDGDMKFVRPIRWILALFGAQAIEFDVAGIAAGKLSMGHRQRAENPVTVEAPCDYFEMLFNNFVIVDQEKRALLVREEIESAVRTIGGRAVIHQHTFDEVVELVEFPHAVVGSFASDFVSLPRDVLVTAMESHQRYFPVEDADGALLPNFIVIHNGDPKFTDIIQKGHERVIRARLSDAKYFFEADSAKPLESYVEKLNGVVFQVKLGTVYQKTQRVVKLAEEIAKSLALAPDEMGYAVRAAYLCKADLVTEMVGEFPTLQGAMGRDYAQVSGEPPAVATAIFEHYLPRSAGDSLPATVSGQVVSISDKLDAVAGILAAGLIPTGSEDPYALRRQAHGIVSIILENDLDISMDSLIELALKLYADQGIDFDVEATHELIDEFFRARVRAYLQGRELSPDIVEAVTSGSIDDIVDIMRRAQALQSKHKSDELEDVLVAFIRCKNLGRVELGTAVDDNLFIEDAEKALYVSAVKIDRDVEQAGRDYAAAIGLLAGLRPAVDRFFDDVLVMADDEGVKDNRIRLLNLCYNTYRRVADFAFISAR